MAPSSSPGCSNASEVPPPWEEKYRPIDFMDFVGNELAVSTLLAIASFGFPGSDMPNLILSGPSGTGKTSGILALARSILGSSYHDLVKEIDASAYRDGDVLIREIKMFAESNLKIDTGKYRMVILYGTACINYEPLGVLRRMMEEYSHSTRFALIFNTDGYMIDIEKHPYIVLKPFQNICTHVEFSRLSDAMVAKRLWVVLNAEKVPSVPGGVDAVVSLANGDMRQALNISQATYRQFASVNRENVLKAHRRLQFPNGKSVTPDVTESTSDHYLGFLGLRNSPSVGENEEGFSQKRVGDRCEDGRGKRLCVCEETGEEEELQGIIRDWKVRFADVEIKRKETKKRLKMVEKEKAELLRKVAELEKALAE